MYNNSKNPWDTYKTALDAAKTSLSSDKSALISLYGSNDYLLGQSKSILRKLWREKTQGDLVSLDKIPTKELPSFLGQPSLFSEKRGFFYTLKRKDAIKKITQHFQKHANFSVLIIERGAKTSTIGRSGIKIGCFPLPPYALGRYIREVSHSLGLDISPHGVNLLEDVAAVDLSLLVSELQKLRLLYGNKRIELPMVEKACTFVASSQTMTRTFEALLGRDISQAMATMLHLLGEGKSPLMLLGMLARHCRNGICIQQQMETGGSLPNRIDPKLVRKYRQLLNATGVQVFTTGLVQCQKADLAMKTSSLPAESLLSELVLHLMPLSP